MRLWHKNLIEVLPRQQLLGQWRECCLIAKNIAEKGTPNHILVNKIMLYPIEHFYSYAMWVFNEMKYRGYKCDFNKFEKWYFQIEGTKPRRDWFNKPLIFPDWHNVRYLKQCFYNLQEKYDCSGIPEDEWQKIYYKYEFLNVGFAAVAMREATDALKKYSERVVQENGGTKSE